MPPDGVSIPERARYRITDWAHRFEISSSRKLKRLDWVAIPNSFDDDGYIVLVDHPNGAAHFGAWMVIVQIASKQNPRGTLPNGKISQSLGGICQALGRLSRLPATIFEELLPRLIEIGWLEILAESPSTSADSPTTLADSPSTLAKSADTDIHTDRQTNRQDRSSSVESSSDLLKQADMHPQTPKQGNGNGWHAFEETYTHTGRHTTDADLKAAKPIWNKLDLAEQIACVHGIRRDIEQQKYSGPEFWPKPRKYLHEREWERKPQAPRRGPKSKLLEGVFDA